MAQACARCSRLNPSEAVYCFFDGSLLQGHQAAARLPSGSQPFASEFVFPDGQACRNFDQLALASQQRWAVAGDLLQQGIFERFFGGLGRADLAQAARAAAAFPDRDRGLDQLLGGLPTQVLSPPKLQVSPGELNLGQLRPGKDQSVVLHLENLGGRLLYGTVDSDSNWLTLGDAPGASQRLFQFGGDTTIPLQIRGQHLRAGLKPVEGRLTIESNGGQATVLVRAEVPVVPFPEGVLAGASTPRQIAEKARLAPKDSAALFEQGLVARWFQENGWTYPVPGPAASGLSAVQQFFEALGLARAPKVEISASRIDWQGRGGEVLRQDLEVRTEEKRPVFAFASVNEAWLAVECRSRGKASAQVLVSARVPGQYRGSLQAQVTVTANGNQRFVVPVTLDVLGAGSPNQGNAHLPDNSGEVAIARFLPDEATAPSPSFTTSRRAADRGVNRQDSATNTTWALHLIPALLLTLTLLGLLVRDVLSRSGRHIPSRPGTTVHIEGDKGDGSGDTVAEVAVDPTPRVLYQYGSNLRFGLETKGQGVGNGKQLTFSRDGESNTTVVRIDGQAVEFGVAPGTVLSTPSVPSYRPGESLRSKAVWSWNNVQVTQALDLVPGRQPADVDGTPKRLLDTCLIGYQIQNLDDQAHRVGIRVLIDTLIGSHDGVPFMVPGRNGLVDTFADFNTPKQVPDFIQALEVPNLRAPGTVAHMSLKLGEGFEAPDRVSLTHWPGLNYRAWNIPLRPMGSDSAVALYWREKALQPGAKRTLGFAYGLGTVSGSEGGGQLALTLSGSFEPGEEFTVAAYVNRPRPAQTVTLILPKGLERTQGEPMQAVLAQDGKDTGVVTWRVRVLQTGRFPLEVRSSTGVTQARTLIISQIDPQKKQSAPDHIFR
jgi:hypothetical protein